MLRAQITYKGVEMNNVSIADLKEAIKALKYYGTIVDSKAIDRVKKWLETEVKQRIKATTHKPPPAK